MNYLVTRSPSGSAALRGVLFNSGSGSRTALAPQLPAAKAGSPYAFTMQPSKSTGSRRVQRFIGSLYPVADDILSPFLKAARADLFGAATQLHRRILANATDPEYLDDLLASPRLPELPDALAIALLRGTFSFRPALKHWIGARDTIRDRMRDEGANVETLMRGLL